MWLQFAPPAVRWLSFACFVVLVLALLAMPREERARLLRAVRGHSARRRPPPTAHDRGVSPETGDANVAGRSHDLRCENPQMPRKYDTVVVAARFALVGSTVVILALLLWMVIAFVLNVPGWR
jgi:hypothetical protein